MNTPVARIVSLAYRRRSATLILVVCLAAVSLAGARRLSFDTDVITLLPRSGQAGPAFRTFVRQFGSLDQLYVVFSAPAGHAIDEYEAGIAAWAERLRRMPEISAVDTGGLEGSRNLGWLADRRLVLLPDDALDIALARLDGRGMREALAARRELLAVPSPALEQLVRLDPLGLFDLLREGIGRSSAVMAPHVTERGYVSADGRSRLLIAQPAAPPFDTAFSRALLTRLEALRRELPAAAEPSVQDEPAPPMEVAFAGGHRIAVETEAMVRRESVTNTLGALALILPLLLLVFRSVWLAGVGPLPSAVALLVVLGALGAAGATLSAAATASAAMLFGLGVDGVVLLYVAYTLEASRGADDSRALQGLAGPATSMLLGMWTTAATFYGLTVLDFPSLEQLGALIGHSMLLCGVLTLVLVPALLPRRRRRAQNLVLVMPGLAGWVARRPRTLVAAAAVVTVALGCAAAWIRVNPTLDRLRSVTPGAADLDSVAPTFGLPLDVYVVLQQGPDLEELLRSNERLHAAAAAGVPDAKLQFVSMLLPSRETQARRIARIRAAGVSPSRVTRELDAAAAAEGFRPGAFDAFHSTLPRLLDGSQRVTYEGYVANGLEDLIGRFVSRNRDEWFLASYVVPGDHGNLSRLRDIAATFGGGATLTGLPLVNRELAERFLPEFLKGLSVGTVLVLALVFAAFRDWRLSLLALAPTGFGLVWAAGLLGLAGVEMDLFAVFAVVTFVGIGVDYGIHLVHRYKERGDALRATAELAPVILVAGSITLLGYGTLVTSTYPPLQSIGTVSVVSVVTLAAASLLVLPALLYLMGRPRRDPGR